MQHVAHAMVRLHQLMESLMPQTVAEPTDVCDTISHLFPSLDFLAFPPDTVFQKLSGVWVTT